LGRVGGTIKTGHEIRQELLDGRIRRNLRCIAMKAFHARKKDFKHWVLPAWAKTAKEFWWLSEDCIPAINVARSLSNDDEQDDVESVLSTPVPLLSDLDEFPTSPVDEITPETYDIISEVEMEDVHSSLDGNSDTSEEDVRDSRTPSSDRSSSPPPEYVPPISLPISQSTRARITSRSHLPRYHTNQYSNRSPSPPPPYNAHTDCETLVSPIFIDDEDEEEHLMARIRPAAIRSPTPELVQRMIGAFPEEENRVEQVIGTVRGGTDVRVREMDSRIAWDRALELEEADEYNLDEAIHRAQEREDQERQRLSEGGALGSIARWIGGIWRR